MSSLLELLALLETHAISLYMQTSPKAEVYCIPVK